MAQYPIGTMIQPHMVNMSGPNPHMGQSGAMHPGIPHPNMMGRPGGHPHMGQAGNMMPPGSMAPNGMGGHAMSHLQPTPMFNQQMQGAHGQGQGFPQGMVPTMTAQQHLQQQQQQQLLRQRQMMAQAQANQQNMMGMAPQMGLAQIHPMNHLRQQGNGMPAHLAHMQQQQQAQAQANEQIRAQNEAQARANPALMQLNQQMHVQGSPMRHQASMQGMRAEQQQQQLAQTGQQGQASQNAGPPQTPQNAQLQRLPRSQAPQNPQQMPTSMAPQQHLQQPQTSAAQDVLQLAAQAGQLQGISQAVNVGMQVMAPNLPPQRMMHNMGPQSSAMQQSGSGAQDTGQDANEHQRITPQLQQQQMSALQRQRTQIVQQQGQLISRLQSFCLAFNTICTSLERQDLESWQSFVGEHFNEDGHFHLQYKSAKAADGVKSFQVCVPVLARYFVKHFACGIERMSIALGDGTGTPLPDEIPSTMSYYFKNKNHTIASGNMRAVMSGNKFAIIEFLDIRHEEYVSRQLLSDAAIPDPRLSPEKGKMSKAKSQAAKREAENPSLVELNKLPVSDSGDYGTTKAMQQTLETIENMSNLRPLLDFAVNNLHLKPKEAMAEYLDAGQNKPLVQQPQNMAQQSAIAQQQQRQQQHHLLLQQQHSQLHAGQNPYANLMQAQMNGGLQTPGINGPGGMLQQYYSPAHMNTGLPNSLHSSPHIGNQMQSPHTMGGMQAPMMHPQHSHQGTINSATGSSSASPNVTGKRRRQRVAKPESNEGGGDNNGMSQGGPGKVKASPRPGKKQKGSH